MDFKHQVAAELESWHQVVMEASPVNEYQTNAVAELAVQTVAGMVRTHKLALAQSYVKELDADHAVVAWLIMHAAVIVSLFELAAAGGQRTRDPVASSTGELPMFRECVFYLLLEGTRGKRKRAGGEVLQWSVSRSETLNQSDVHRHKDEVVRAAASKRKTEQERFSGLVNSTVGTPWWRTSAAQKDGEEVFAARYTLAQGSGEQPLLVKPAVRGGPGGVLDPRTVFFRARVDIEKYGTTPGCPGCDAILPESQAKSHSTACRDRIMTEMQQDDRLA